MCVGMFLVLLDVTVINVALPAMSTGLGAGIAQLQWIVTAYTITFAALLLSGGALGDIHGHRRMVLSGLVVFGIGSGLCGLAWATDVLIVARALQGIGGALLLPATLAIITRAFPKRREQARAIGIWAGVSSLALPAGPVLGGALVAGAGWRAVFWINLPLVAVAIALTVKWVPKLRVVGGRLDIAGMLTGGVSLAAIVFAVINAGRTGASAGTVAAAVIGGLGVFAFLAVERRADTPVFPMQLWKSRAFVGANAVAGAMNFVGIGTIFVLTLYLQDARGLSPLVGGVAMLPLFVPLAVMSPLTGSLTARRGPNLPIVFGLGIGAVGSASLLSLAPNSGYAVLLPALLGLGCGMGLLTAAVVAAAMNAAPPERPGLGSSVNNTARQAAGALGTAVYGAITGSPGHRIAFISGIQVAGVVGAALWIGAIAVTLVCLPKFAIEHSHERSAG
ncbi:DHA2 family methylenomycin A resistance protein-like MFS transporter [Antricoccus suffuscus]|uniref:DHA2 family methylenomycin A resistance protein-like MFS transporter n=2 Tax=Antricoccus suffuscus TaxID=1629062 RepID=A0A2T1A4A5_9ACTN|nr:DHA2 family methylenomycin A resistance protein-like MFS transporter [Antricoccus suffuscus]